VGADRVAEVEAAAVGVGSREVVDSVRVLVEVVARVSSVSN
jgi:hypothetical protein